MRERIPEKDGSDDFFVCDTMDGQDTAYGHVMMSDPNPDVAVIVDSFDKEMVKEIRALSDGARVWAYCMYRSDSVRWLANIMDKDCHFVIAVGDGVVSWLTGDDSMNVARFYTMGSHTVRSCFWHPVLRAMVYPIDALDVMFRHGSRMDTWETYFAENQFRNATLYDISLPLNQNRREPVVSKNRIGYCSMVAEMLESHTGDGKPVFVDLKGCGKEWYGFSISEVMLSFSPYDCVWFGWDERLVPVLTKFFSERKLWAYDAKLTIEELWRNGVRGMSAGWDIRLAGELLNDCGYMNSSTDFHSRSTMRWIYSNHGGCETVKDIASHGDMARNHQIYTERGMDLCAIDRGVAEAQRLVMGSEPDLVRFYKEEGLPAIDMFADIEERGVVIDVDALGKLEGQIVGMRKECESDIIREAFLMDTLGEEYLKGRDSAVVSDSDLEMFRKSLPEFDGESGFSDYMKMKYVSPFMSWRMGKNGVGKLALEEVSMRGYRIAGLLLRHAGMVSCSTTFAGKRSEHTGYWKFLDNDKPLIYPSYGVMEASSCRNVCRNPNIQQKPTHNSMAEPFSHVFGVPSNEGLCGDRWMFVECDYSSAQLRILAMYSQDENLLKVFRNFEGDMHSMTACAVFHPFGDVTLSEFMQNKETEPYASERALGKTINFGLVFGMSSWTFSKKLALVWDEAKARLFVEKVNAPLIKRRDGSVDWLWTASDYMRNKFFLSYPSLVTWRDRMVEEGVSNGYVRGVFGNVRRVPQLSHMGSDIDFVPSDRKVDERLKKICVNSLVQTHEVVLIMRAMRKFETWAKENRAEAVRPTIRGMIHDAVFCYVPKTDLEALGKLKDFMEEDCLENRGVPMTCKFSISDPSNPDKPTYWGFGDDDCDI